ncbi:MAG: acetylxylan esterase [Verrucomicrobiota bacterium]
MNYITLLTIPFTAVCACAGVSASTITNEAEIPPYTLPDPLVCQDGTRVTDARTWRAKRRPELLHLFASEEYGKTLLGRPEAMRFVLREEKKEARGGKATRLQVGVLFEGKEDGRQMELLVYLPNQVKGPVPVFLGFNFDGNYTTTDEPDIPLAKHYAMGLYANRLVKNTPTEAGRGIHKEMWQYDLALEHGYGVVTAGYGEIEPDANGRWQEGPRGLGPEPGAEDWGCIGAWAWGYSRALDYLETNPRVDAKRVALIGFSRLGKTALWAAAQDERFAMLVANNSGAGGVALSKRIFGETVANLTANLGRWFCPNFRQYATNEAALPMDQHELAALIAPRPLLITSATQDLWSDPKGEFLGGLGADPVYRLLGTDGLACKEWPGAGQLVDSRIGYFLRVGKHDVTLEDWQAMVTYADKHFRKK